MNKKTAVPVIQEEKKYTPKQIKAIYEHIRSELCKSLLFAQGRKARHEELMKRPSVGKLSDNKRARLSRRFIEAGQAIEETVSKIEKLDLELRNL